MTDIVRLSAVQAAPACLGAAIGAEPCVCEPSKRVGRVFSGPAYEAARTYAVSVAL